MIPRRIYQASADICGEVRPARWRRLQARSRDLQTRRLLASTIMTVISNAVDATTPESRLCLAVLGYAVRDLVMEPEGTEEYSTAHWYLWEGTMGPDCDCIGLDPAYVRRVLAKFGLKR